MVVVVLTDCPAKLRGDLSKWLFEINTGVYVGNLSTRVRELLWERICENVRHGQATMVYSAQGEQKLEFCVHNTSWKIVDFDGIKLMQRPLPKHNDSDHDLETTLCADGFSKASQYEKNRRIQISKQKAMQNQDDYVVVDVETTGLSHLSDEIIEIGALRVAGGEPVEEFHSLVRCKNKIPESVKNLTGITDEELLKDGRELHEVLQELNEFLSNSMLICHNAAFDLNFIQSACKRANIQVPRNKCADTLILAKKKLKGIRDYKLSTIAEKLSVDTDGLHRALRDCYITYGIYKKLNEI
jgi:CRISPR-associated protein Cas2